MGFFKPLIAIFGVDAVPPPPPPLLPPVMVGAFTPVAVTVFFTLRLLSSITPFAPPAPEAGIFG